MPKLTKAARAALLAVGDPTSPEFIEAVDQSVDDLSSRIAGDPPGPSADYHPSIVDEFTDADGEQMVELADGNIEAAEDWGLDEPTDLEALQREDLDRAEEPYTPPRVELPRIDRKVKPTTLLHGTKLLYYTGFCSGGDESHDVCRGGTINGNGVVAICACPRHEGENRCQICRTVSEPDQFDSERRICLDVDACEDALNRQAVAAAQTPLAQMIRAVKESSRRGQQTTATEGGLPGRTREPRAPRTSKPDRQPRPCQCGCGLLTGGGLFRPGHDAKLKGVLKRAAKDDDVAAMVELLARGWPTPDGEVPLGSVEQAHLADEQAKQDYIATRVATRYADAPEAPGE